MENAPEGAFRIMSFVPTALSGCFIGEMVVVFLPNVVRSKTQMGYVLLWFSKWRGGLLVGEMVGTRKVYQNEGGRVKKKSWICPFSYPLPVQKAANSRAADCWVVGVLILVIVL